MFTRKLVIANEWIRLSDIPDSVSISFRGVLEITESTGVPDASTPLLRLENEMAPITVDSLSWVRVPVDSQKDITVYIHK
ncbi:TPA: hypothetical protein MYQ36_002670 [Citrobacter braakii]|jgi:hypothetical protein|uniref:Uncharacterized protein n=1 Tax=Citrobacter braakii TaxID=57706 RepID=A0A1R0FZV4_CITBR|nr:MULTISPECIES: hypothetical protein [Citrobacter]MBA7794966.1 hypothetical protein [Citrobacter sp. RHBSTW-01065]MCI1672300.1 hypothetical protein [Citrobacter freundii]TKV33021.1 hypothetical protein FDX20_14885 [Citrobacter sp. TBCS-11]ASE44582.1 hypothetical protein CEP69_18515 [Citrobacter braakii]EGT0622591.1 hypothetical protein [Citrobacter braakii]